MLLDAKSLPHLEHEANPVPEIILIFELHMIHRIKESSFIHNTFLQQKTLDGFSLISGMVNQTYKSSVK